MSSHSHSRDNRFRPPVCRSRLRRPILALIIAALGVTAARAAVTRPPRMIAPGVSHTIQRRAEGPFDVNIVELDPAQQYISLACAAGAKLGERNTVNDLAQLRSSPSRYAVAAVNGDYFDTAGEHALLGLDIAGGEVLTTGVGLGRSALVVLEGGRAQVATLRLEAWLQTAAGARVSISYVNLPRGRSEAVLYTSAFGASTRTPPSGREVALSGIEGPLELGKMYELKVIASTHGVGDLVLAPGQVVVSASGGAAEGLAGLAVGDAVKLCVDLVPHLQGRIVEAVGGGPRLVRDGAISVEWTQENFRVSHSQQRHARTAVGVRPDGHVLLVTVDGRQARSVGMTLDELARLMLELGCRDALNLDGGSSTTMWVRGEVVNSPCGGGQGRVVNALLVMSSAPHGPPTRIRLVPEFIIALPGYRATVMAEAQDEYYNPLGFSTTGIGWAYEGAIGEISPLGEFTAANVSETVTGAIKVYLSGATASVPVTVYASPPQLWISPQVVTATPRQEVRFTVKPVDQEGQPLSFDPARVQWQAEPAAGQIDEQGVLVAGSGPGGKVSATLCGVTATARVIFSSTTTVVEDFEQESTRTASSWPREVPASWEWVTDPVRDGRRAARLKYDFTTTKESRAAHLQVGRDVGNAVRLRAWVFGDGNGHWLRAKVTDGRGQGFNLDLAPRVDWSGWREVAAAVPPEAQAPLRWDSIYVSEFRSERQDAGSLVFDLLRAEVAESAH